MSAQGLPTGLVGPRHMLPLAQDHPSIESAALGFAFESSLVTNDGTAIALNEHRVSQQFFDVFNTPMAMGRNFKPEESFDRIVLSYRLWRDAFHSDRNILGSVIRVSGAPLVVVGVAAPGFDFPNHTQVWTKMYLPPGSNILTNMEGYVRLRPGDVLPNDAQRVQVRVAVAVATADSGARAGVESFEEAKLKDRERLARDNQMMSAERKRGPIFHTATSEIPNAAAACSESFAENWPRHDATNATR